MTDQQRIEQLERNQNLAIRNLQDACTCLVALRSFLRPEESALFEEAQGYIHDARSRLGEYDEFKW